MPDPTLTQLREAEAWAERDLRATSPYQLLPPLKADPVTMYRDAVAARVREEERGEPWLDTTRLDWLEQAVESGEFKRLSASLRGLWRGSFRAWIDAAMQSNALRKGAPHG